MSDTEIPDAELPDAAPAAASSPPAEPSPLPPPQPPPAAAPPPTARRWRLWPLLGLLGFLLLAAGEIWLWRQQQSRPDQSQRIATLQAEVAALQQQAAAPPPAPSPAPATAAPPPNPPAAGLDQKLAALAATVTGLQAEAGADHNAVTSLQANQFDIGKFTADLAAVQTEATVDHAALLTLQSNVADLGKQTGKAAALGRLEAAGLALAAGQPLGTLPNAPPALAGYATTPPPTEAALRLAYPDAARAADNASTGEAAGHRHGYWRAVVARLENLVTVSNGSHVILGAPAAGITTAAAARLEAGDLAGAVDLLNTLSPTAQQAMANWLTQARGLVAARAALLALAAPN